MKSEKETAARVIFEKTYPHACKKPSGKDWEVSESESLQMCFEVWDAALKSEVVREMAKAAEAVIKVHGLSEYNILVKTFKKYQAVVGGTDD